MRCLLTLVLALALVPTVGWADQAQYTLSPEQVRWANDLVNKGQAACETGEFPLSLVREAFFGRQRSISCMIAVEALNGLRDEASVEDRKAVHNDYRKSCLVTFGSVTDPKGGYPDKPATSNHLTFMSSTEEVSKLEHSIGTLSHPLEDDYCSAALVDLGDGNASLVTALHCIGHLDTVEEGVVRLATVRPKIDFRNIAGERITLRLPLSIAGRILKYPTEDVVALLLPVRSASVIPTSSIGPKGWEPLLVLGVNPYLSGKLSDEKNALVDLSEMIAVSLEPYCVAFGLNNEGQLFHNCQTERSQSGSAILTIRGGKFVYSGVHTRAEVGKSSACDGGIPSYNSGLAIGILSAN